MRIIAKNKPTTGNICKYKYSVNVCTSQYLEFLCNFEEGYDCCFFVQLKIRYKYCNFGLPFLQKGIAFQQDCTQYDILLEVTNVSVFSFPEKMFCKTDALCGSIAGTVVSLSTCLKQFMYIILLYVI